MWYNIHQKQLTNRAKAFIKTVNSIKKFGKTEFIKIKNLLNFQKNNKSGNINPSNLKPSINYRLKTTMLFPLNKISKASKMQFSFLRKTYQLTEMFFSCQKNREF